MSRLEVELFNTQPYGYFVSDAEFIEAAKKRADAIEQALQTGADVSNLPPLAGEARVFIGDEFSYTARVYPTGRVRRYDESERPFTLDPEWVKKE